MALATVDLAIAERDAMALVDERLEYSWSELDVVLDRATNLLLDAKLGDARRIAVFAHNSAEAVITYLSGLHAGVSSVPVNYHLTVEELVHILKDSGAEMLFVGPETAQTGLDAARRAGVKRVIGWRCPGMTGVEAWNQAIASAAWAPPATDSVPRPYLHYTSGTTGRPKGTLTPPSMLPRASDLGGMIAALRQLVSTGPTGPSLLVGPLYHTGPLTAIRGLAGGKPLVIMSRFDPELVLALVERWQISSMVMVPTHFQRLLALPAETRARYDNSSLKLVSHTGAACPADVKRAMIDWFGPILVEAYGGTEAGTVNMITSQEWLAHPGSVGKTVAPFEVVVVGDDGQPLPPGQDGRLYFRDPSGRGIVYHNDSVKTNDAHLAPGIFTLGDVGYVDEEGYVFITDRASDMIVSGGVNIYPAEIEQVLVEHPDVADVAVIGVPNAEMGEEVKALVVSRSNQTPDAAELTAYCRERLAGFKCPRSFDWVHDIGRNAMGKLDKRALRQPYWPGDRTIGG